MTPPVLTSITIPPKKMILKHGLETTIRRNFIKNPYMSGEPRIGKHQ